MTPEQTDKIFENFDIRHIELEGIKSKGNFDVNKCSDEEFETIKDTKCLYFVRLRHEELPEHFHGTYDSWNTVESELRKLKSPFTPLYNYVRNNELGDNIKLEIKIVSLKNKFSIIGNQTRYMKIFISGKDVTTMVAKTAGYKISYARNTYETAIVHGCGMDMGFSMQRNIFDKAVAYGCPYMFDEFNYHLIQ